MSSDKKRLNLEVEAVEFRQEGIKLKIRGAHEHKKGWIKLDLDDPDLDTLTRVAEMIQTGLDRNADVLAHVGVKEGRGFICKDYSIRPKPARG